jgi:hypothetical protein
VQLSDLEDILAPTHDIVIKFIPRSQYSRLAIGTQNYVEKQSVNQTILPKSCGCKFWPWKLCDWRKAESIDGSKNKVSKPCKARGPGNCFGLLNKIYKGHLHGVSSVECQSRCSVVGDEEKKTVPLLRGYRGSPRLSSRTLDK